VPQLLSEIDGAAGLENNVLDHRPGVEGLEVELATALAISVLQDPLGRLELVILEQVGVQVGQLDGVPDLLDLPGRPPMSL
jgi:hypothetical protein